MVLFRVIVGTLWVSILLIGRGIWTPADSVTPRVSIATDAGATLPGAHTDERNPLDGTSHTPRLDLYGNPIESAVGDYRTDPRGDLYERHAPDTAMLELAPAGV